VLLLLLLLLLVSAGPISLDKYTEDSAAVALTRA